MPCGRCRQLSASNTAAGTCSSITRAAPSGWSSCCRTLSAPTTSRLARSSHSSSRVHPAQPLGKVAGTGCRARTASTAPRAGGVPSRFGARARPRRGLGHHHQARRPGNCPMQQIDWVVDAFTRGECGRRADVGAGHGDLLPRDDARGDTPVDGRDDRVRSSAWTSPTCRRPTVDKHSTGGVGDKITLPLAPLVAACGAAVPQLSGRGLGHTGGTLDKLEAIPGWRADARAPPDARRSSPIPPIGAVVCAAGADLAPADRRLYALRDVTGTVESIPLIASSIMSKKIAEGTGALVLDVKVGSRRVHEEPRRRATNSPPRWSNSGSDAGVRTVALLTAMDTPLGRTAGNALEVAESRGGARRGRAGRRRRTHPRAGAGDARGGRNRRRRPRRRAARRSRDGPLAGDGRRPGRRPRCAAADRAAHRGDPCARVDGVLARLDAMAVGLAAWRLGAGRARQGEPVQAAAGVSCTPSRGRRWRRARRCSPCTPTRPNGLRRGRQRWHGAREIGGARRSGADPRPHRR